MVASREALAVVTGSNFIGLSGGSKPPLTPLMLAVDHAIG
jgi:hypothetical protein